MVKVLQVHGGMNIGGTESVLMNWYRNIDRENLQFDFTTTFLNECPYDKEIKGKGGKIKYIRPIKESGIGAHTIDLYKVIKKGKYDVVHSHMNFHGGIVAIVAKLCGVKCIVCHSHSIVLEKDIKVKNRVLRKLINIFANKKIACSKEAGRAVFGNQEKIEIIKNFVDERFLNQENINKIREIKRNYEIKSKKIIVQIGRIDKNKNQIFSIKMFEELRKKSSEYELIFIGDGEEKQNIESEIKKRDLGDFIKCVGNQSDIEDWLEIAEVVILPSKYEGVPMIIIEAQTKGKMCLISDKVNRECDLGLGLIRSISIEEKNISRWVEEILNYKINKINKEEIKRCLDEKGYTKSKNIEQLLKIYEI